MEGTEGKTRQRAEREGHPTGTVSEGRTTPTKQSPSQAERPMGGQELSTSTTMKQTAEEIRQQIQNLRPSESLTIDRKNLIGDLPHRLREGVIWDPEHQILSNVTGSNRNIGFEVFIGSEMTLFYRTAFPLKENFRAWVEPDRANLWELTNKGIWRLKRSPENADPYQRQAKQERCPDQECLCQLVYTDQRNGPWRPQERRGDWRVECRGCGATALGGTLEDAWMQLYHRIG